MKNLIDAVFIINICICSVALLLYLPRISYFFTAFKKQKRFKNDKKNKIAVIVPARDESAVIEACLISLKNQTYDPDFFDTFVVVADQYDKTIEITKKFENVHTIVVQNQTCKGDALDGCLKTILKKNPDKYDAYIIIDADNLAEEDFIEEMNNALASGRQIVNGKKKIKNWQTSNKNCRSLISNCTALTYTNIDDMGNKYRTEHNIPINTIGTGLLVRADVIKELGGWPFRCMVEDYELMMESMLRGYTSMYYSYAVVYTEEAISHKMANKRRMRWIKGYVQCCKKYKKQIHKKTFSDGRIKWRYFDFLYGIIPIIIFLIGVLVSGVFFLGTSVVFFFSKNQLMSYVFRRFLFNFSLMYTLGFIYSFITIMAARKEMRISFIEKLTILLFNPLILFEYIYIYVCAFLSTAENCPWEKIERIPFELDETFEETMEKEEEYV